MRALRDEHDVAPEQPGRQRLGTGRLDGVEPGLGNRGQDIDELAIAVVMAGQPPADLSRAVGIGEVFDTRTASSTALETRPTVFACRYAALLGRGGRGVFLPPLLGDQSRQIFQITPVPGIWTSGPF